VSLGRAAAKSEAFLRDFLLSLLKGGSVDVALPMDRATYRELQIGLEGMSGLWPEVAHAIELRAETLLRGGSLFALNQAFLRHAVVLYQVLVALHGAAERGELARRRLQTINVDALRLLSDALPQGRDALVAQHVLLDPVFNLVREDVRVTFRWGPRLHFYGEPVRWRKWPWRTRAVLDDGTGVDVAVALFERVTAQAWHALLHCSPVTCLVRADRLFGRLDASRLAPVFADETLCRYATHAICEQGFVGHFATLSDAAVGLLRGAGGAREGLTYVRFLFNLALTHAFWSPDVADDVLRQARYQPPTRQLRVEAPGSSHGTASVVREAGDAARRDAQERARALRLGWALLQEVMERCPRLDWPRGDDELDAMAVLRGRAQRLAGGEPLRQEARTLLAQARLLDP